MDTELLKKTPAYKPMEPSVSQVSRTAPLKAPVFMLAVMLTAAMSIYQWACDGASRADHQPPSRVLSEDKVRVPPSRVIVSKGSISVDGVALTLGDTADGVSTRLRSVSISPPEVTKEGNYVFHTYAVDNERLILTFARKPKIRSGSYKLVRVFTSNYGLVEGSDELADLKPAKVERPSEPPVDCTDLFTYAEARAKAQNHGGIASWMIASEVGSNARRMALCKD